MKRISKSILTIGITTSIMLDSLLITDIGEVSADSISQNDNQNIKKLELFKSSEVTNKTTQLATSASQTTENFNNSLQNTINNLEA